MQPVTGAASGEESIDGANSGGEDGSSGTSVKIPAHAVDKPAFSKPTESDASVNIVLAPAPKLQNSAQQDPGLASPFSSQQPDQVDGKARRLSDASDRPPLQLGVRRSSSASHLDGEAHGDTCRLMFRICFAGVRAAHCVGTVQGLMS